MARFFLVQPPKAALGSTPTDQGLESVPIEFEDFIHMTKGLSISSAAALSRGRRGQDFLEFGLSKTFNLRIDTDSDEIIVSLIKTLNSDDFSPIRVEIIGKGEIATAELVQDRIFYLRQIYAMAFLLYLLNPVGARTGLRVSFGRPGRD